VWRVLGLTRKEGAPLNRTQTLSEYVAGATRATLDPSVARLASLHLLDTLASVVACRDLEPAVVARRYVAARAGTAGTDTRTATILGTNERAPLVDAVFAGAMTAHAAEINDFIPSVFVQPGPAVVATALGVGEARGASGDELVGAIVAGYELAARVPRALGVGTLRRAGIANHGIGPCFGAAVAAAALVGLPAERIADVLSFTAQQAAGSWQWLLDVEHIEKAFVFAGLGARNGLEAVLMVEAGFRGVPDVADRPGTWFTSRRASREHDDGDLDALTVDLGHRSVFADTAFKRYPVGGPTQPAVEALLDLRAQVRPDLVERVVIEMPGRWEAFRDAQMPALNLPYLAAIILIDGSLDFVAAQSLERMRGDDTVHELMARVEIRHDPAQEAAPGDERTESARVAIELQNGQRLERFVPHVLGFPSHPMTSADVEAKAHDLVAPHLGDQRANQLITVCREPSAHRAADLVALIAR
jgi:2-methylcitrate dehydratase PrpD